MSGFFASATEKIYFSGFPLGLKNLGKWEGIFQSGNFEQTGKMHELRVPTRTGKPRKMGRHFPVKEKSENFEQTGKVRENHTQYWKTQGI